MSDQVPSAAKDDHQRQRILEGLGAMAVTVAEMGGTPQQIAETVGRQMLRFELVTPDDVLDVAAAISLLPQPLNESAEHRERARPIEKLLGVPSPEQLLVATLAAREALEEFARQLRQSQ